MFTTVSLAQNDNYFEKRTQKAFGKIDFLSIDMPTTTIPNEKNMGFTGIHYNLMINNWAYAGLGIYGAVTGERGGFFTLGVNAGIKSYLSESFYFDAGFHFGAGGGASAPDGGGAFILPHFNIGYDFKNFSLNSGWSYVDFFDGGLIQSHQLNVGVEIPLDFSYADYRAAENEYNIQMLESKGWNIFSKRTSLMLHQNNLMIKGDTKRSNGVKYNGETIRLAGFELASFLTKNWFGFVKVDGAFDGIQAGYMDIFLGAGYLFTFNKNRTNLLAKFGVGAGGGGGIETEGGFLIYPDISIEQKLFQDVFLAINTGFVMSPNSNVFTQSYGFGIKYYVERNGTKSNETNYSSGKFKGLEIITKHDVYLNAERDNITTAPDMHQISLQVNLDLNKNLFIAGQTSFASFGDAGAYAEGIVGLGFKSNPILNNKASIFIQALAGAAGGGGISTGEGLILKSSTGISYNLNDKLGLRAAVGYVKARGGNLSSTFFNIGINYRISMLSMKK
ncbi:MAG: hypothetical protein HWD82_09305 [Flavobacteriaceae bacterium]|nr:hypothetical protein [Flavobacteriaceae bacterium]